MNHEEHLNVQDQKLKNNFIKRHTVSDQSDTIKTIGG